MSVQSAPFYWLVCDCCGAKAPDGEFDEYAAWAEEGQALDYALDAEWSMSEKLGRHHCPKCEPFCERCDEPAGELSGERDYLCRACWDKQEAEAVDV